eukprot:GEMP01002165.1.p1 GENE.GEMP01002165.1~~GEMP01002165.1.p1  ORF type:complete len:998 (+),score=251.80 GEMP01002165.1:125-3118(+)
MSISAWISSQLHRILSFTSPVVVEGVYDAATEARNSKELERLIVQRLSFPRNSATSQFCEELLARIQAPKDAPVTKKPRIDEDKPLAGSGGASSSNKAPDVETKKDATVENAGPTGAGDAEMDKKEKAEFAERLKLRDQSKTKKLGTLPTAERKEVMFGSTEERRQHLERMREYARRLYLEKREGQIADLKGRYIKDAEWLLQHEDITEEESEFLQTQKELYEVAKERMSTRNDDTIDAYQMPTDYDADDNEGQNRRYGVLEQRYKEEKKEKSDQQLIDEQQIARGAFKITKKKTPGDKYEMVVDEIEFVLDEIHGANMVDDGKQAEADYDVPLAEREKKAKNKLEAKAMQLEEGRKKLPVYKWRTELMDAIEKYNVLIVVGETGSGKTTQIPQFLHDAGYTDAGKIGCTQPRRVAAMSVAARVAEEMGVKLGHEVGYSIRFEDCTTDKTILKYMTDGMLLREFLNEPDLASYSVMIVDEAHERTLHTDVLFGLVKDVTRFRKEFKLIISSATLDAEKFSTFFDNAPIFNVPGRRFPVAIHYTTAPEANYLDALVITILQIHMTQPLGDILVFCTGQQEIEEAIESISQKTRGLGTSIKELIVLPIYANLPTDLQAKIFEQTPEGARKVVLATNIAETSITIDNIVFVIDPGFCKQNAFNPRTGMESLQVVPVSKASANQRAGRAGRVCPGKCYRLFTKWSFQNEMEDNNAPEILRTNLGHVVLMLKSVGIDDLLHFDFMDAPPPETLIKALEQLYALSALNDKGELTKLGRRMAEFPMDPMMSKMLIQSEKYKCVDEVVTICGMLGVGNSIFYVPKDKKIHADNARKNFFKPGGDHLTYLNVYKQWEETHFSTQWCYENFVQFRSMNRARDIRDQLLELLDRVEVELVSNPNDVDGIRKAICSGFFYHMSRLSKTGSYTTVKYPHTVEIHPLSSMFEVKPKLACYHELVLTTKEYMRTIIEVKPEWLLEVAPHYYQQKDLNLESKMPKRVGKAATD